MAETTYTASQSIYVRSTPANRMSVACLRGFVAALDAAGIDDREEITAHKSDVGHLTHLSVRTTKEVPHPDDPAATPTTPSREQA